MLSIAAALQSASAGMSPIAAHPEDLATVLLHMA
jgi:hypothetical protein